MAEIKRACLYLGIRFLAITQPFLGQSGWKFLWDSFFIIFEPLFTGKWEWPPRAFLMAWGLPPDPTKKLAHWVEFLGVLLSRNLQAWTPLKKSLNDTKFIGKIDFWATILQINCISVWVGTSIFKGIDFSMNLVLIFWSTFFNLMFEKNWQKQEGNNKRFEKVSPPFSTRSQGRRAILTTAVLTSSSTWRTTRAKNAPNFRKMRHFLCENVIQITMLTMCSLF